MSEQLSVTEMFDDISPRYDFLNHLLSFHIDKTWRRKTSQWVAHDHPASILDVATGTADLAIRMAKDCPSSQIIGIDLSEKMLEIGKKKITNKQLGNRIKLQIGDAEQIPFPDSTFDAVTTAFGVRNFEHLEQGLEEMFRITKDKGTVAVLEFSHPEKGFIRKPYQCYSRHILPFVGRIISSHHAAYRYLPDTIEAFPKAEIFMNLLKKAGFSEVGKKEYSGGIATLYYGRAQKKNVLSQ